MNSNDSDIIYLDNAATTRTDDEVVRAMLPCFGQLYGNASSIYGAGQASRRLLEQTRADIAGLLGCHADELYFTSGGSESNNCALRGIAAANLARGRHIITSRIEHPSVLQTCAALEKAGWEVTYLGVDNDGLVDTAELAAAIRPDTTLVSIMFANNEIGTIQPIRELAELAKSRGVCFHTDAVQTAGTLPINLGELGVDALSLSAHKFYGPKGVGLLYVRRGVRFESLIAGGHQERGKRAGTENLAGIVGLGKALELAVRDMAAHSAHIAGLRDYYEEQLAARIPHLKFNGHRSLRLPGSSNVSFRFIEGESLLLNLDLKGICASSGSACTSGSLEPSHVLLAIGLPHEIAHGSLRVSIGKHNTRAEIDRVLDSLVEIVNRLREMSPLWEDFCAASQNNIQNNI